jgi:hypothetical protein
MRKLDLIVVEEKTGQEDHIFVLSKTLHLEHRFCNIVLQHPVVLFIPIPGASKEWILIIYGQSCTGTMK